MGKFKTLVRNALPVFVLEDSLSQMESVVLKGNVVCLFDALFKLKNAFILALLDDTVLHSISCPE